MTDEDLNKRSDNVITYGLRAAFGVGAVSMWMRNHRGPLAADIFWAVIIGAFFTGLSLACASLAEVLLGSGLGKEEQKFSGNARVAFNVASMLLGIALAYWILMVA